MRRELLLSKFLFLWGDNLQLSNKPFLCASIACHWMPLVMCERETSSWLFSWFPRRLSPRCTLSLWRSNRCATVSFLKFVSVSSTAPFFRKFSGMSSLPSSVLLGCVKNMFCRGRPASKVMDYLTFEGKLFVRLGSLFIIVRLPVQFDSFFISHVN